MLLFRLLLLAKPPRHQAREEGPTTKDKQDLKSVREPRKELKQAESAEKLEVKATT